MSEVMNDFDQKFADQVRRSERRGRTLKIIFFALILDVLVIPGAVFWYFSLPPSPTNEVIVDIRAGSTARETATQLEESKVIRSALLFRAWVRYKKVDTTLPSGVFLFQPNQNLFQVVDQLARQEHGIERMKITIPEGLSTKQISSVIGAQLPHFDSEQFFVAVEKPGVYIFPDTYFFYTTATSGEVFMVMTENFRIKTDSYMNESVAIGKNWSDIITMASLIEEEAVLDVDRKIVSGILWNRIKLGMRLQVDASFSYLLGKTSAEVTESDFDVDSPYNTYKYAGLPPGPISHPGLSTIESALHPTDTPYLYYLSDDDGNMHYAKTFAEHKLNKARYLR